MDGWLDGGMGTVVTDIIMMSKDKSGLSGGLGTGICGSYESISWTFVIPCHIKFMRSFSTRNDLWIVDNAPRILVSELCVI